MYTIAQISVAGLLLFAASLLVYFAARIVRRILGHAPDEMENPFVH